MNKIYILRDIRVLEGLQMTEEEVIKNSKRPITIRSIKKNLADLGVKKKKSMELL